MSSLMDRFGGKGNTQNNRIVVAANSTATVEDRPYANMSIDDLMREINRCASGTASEIKRALMAELKIRENAWFSR